MKADSDCPSASYAVCDQDWTVEMSSKAREDQLEVLDQKLAEAVELLTAVGESFWADWLNDVRPSIRRSESEGFRRLLLAYGGMGSFNDLLLMPANGHRIEAAEVHSFNDRLDVLRSEIYELARSSRPIVP